MQSITFPELDTVTHVAVAVSGGADSMALAHMLAAYAKRRKKKLHIHAFTVDHGMRTESAKEAQKVSKWLAAWPHTIHATLRWEGIKPQTGAMEAARDARYALLAAASIKAKCTYLAVAHHADDNAETFLMRLAHGSGLDGLAAMKRTQAQGAITLYRPLLDMAHADLVAYCRKNKIKWVEDPTNQNAKYSRTRLRQALADEGFNAKRLGVTLARIDRASKALKDIAAQAAMTALLDDTDNSQCYDLTALKAYPFEIALRVLRTALEDLGTSPYGPRLEKLETVAADLMAATKKTKATLAGCLMRADPRGGRLEILRERT